MTNPLPAAMQYAAYIENVQEIVLSGTADLGFWRDVLKQESLYPHDRNGKAGILISAPKLSWRGARFNEFSVSIAVSDLSDGRSHDGYFLAHAFNSFGFFAFTERLFFKTPYHHARIDVMERSPVSVRVNHGMETVFEAKMNGSRTSARREQDHFQGPVYLPGGRYFTALISGLTDFYPFLPVDMVTMEASRHEQVFQQLLDSNFTPLEWRVREDAIHGKSKTHSRKLAHALLKAQA